MLNFLSLEKLIANSPEREDEETFIINRRSNRVNKSYEIFSIRENARKRNEEIINENYKCSQNNIKRMKELEKVETELIEKLK